MNQIFKDLCSRYINNADIINGFWLEIEQHYSQENRFYHTLSHLENLYIELLEIKDEIENWDVILFSVFYHDIVYDVLKTDNEERSAEFAAQRMKALSVSEKFIQQCESQILATQKHEISIDSDTNYFLDADLSVLGQSLEIFLIYAQNIRKEYSIYPDEIYNQGRKKMLNHFLEMPRIYKTDYFYQKFEEKAKSNLNYELNLYQNNL